MYYVKSNLKLWYLIVNLLSSLPIMALMILPTAVELITEKPSLEDSVIPVVHNLAIGSRKTETTMPKALVQIIVKAVNVIYTIAFT